jgi:hypothetical protein
VFRGKVGGGAFEVALKEGTDAELDRLGKLGATGSTT